MSADDYIPGPGHAQTLESRMKDFHTALTKRWRIEAIDEVCRQVPVTTFLARSTGPFGAPDLKHFLDIRVLYHLGFCHYRNWASEGGNGDLPSSCPGETGFQGHEMPVEDRNNPGKLVQIPPTITCPMPDLMSQVEDWAYAERDSIFARLPLFDAHEQSKLKTAYDALEKLKNALYLEGWQDVGSGEQYSLAGGGDLPGTVTKLWVKDADSLDWWVEWTGLAASTVKGGFLRSTGPTLINHSIIAIALGNLISNRAAIIEHGRNNALYWIEQSTNVLDDKSMSTTDLVPGWKTVTAIGMTVAIYGAATGPGAVPAAVAGGTLQLIGFLGENLFPKIERWDFAQEMKAIVTNFSDRIDSLNENLTTEEGEYAAEVSEMRAAVNGASSFDLELYDLTENSPDGTAAKEEGGFNANVDDILRLGEFCEDAASAYEDLLVQFRDIVAVEGHLADKDGSPIAADTDVVALCNEFLEYVKTTSARYYLARDQIVAAAEAYAESDASQAAAFERTMEDWESQGVGTEQPGFDAKKEAGDTDRPEGADDNPYDSELNGEDVYITEQSQGER